MSECVTCSTADHECDLLIVGAGPAGLSAAMNAAGEGLSTIVLERTPLIGGQASSASRIENYLGFPEGVSGMDLTIAAYDNAVRLGATFHRSAEVIDLRQVDKHIQAMCETGTIYQCQSAIVATGVTYRQLQAPGIERLLGRGVEYGLDLTNPARHADKQAFVVGGANSAGQAAIHLAEHGGTVYIISRSPLSKSMSTYLLERVEDASEIKQVYGRIAAVRGQDRLEEVVIASQEGVFTMRADTLHIFIGAEPNVGWAQIDTDTRGFAAATELQTSIPGVFAAGDVRSGSVKRVAAAAGEGSMAVAQVHRFLTR